MSFIIYDRLAISVARSNYEWSFFRRFDKFWNKTDNFYDTKMMIYENENPVYTEDDIDFTKFLTSLGLTFDDVLGSSMIKQYKDAEIEDYWFELREPVVQTSDDKFEYADALKYINEFAVGQQFEVEFHYGGDASGFYLVDDKSESIVIDNSDPDNPIYLVNPTMSPQEIRDLIMQEPGKYMLGTENARPLSSRGAILIMNNTPFYEYYRDPDSFKSISNKLDYPFKPIIECAFQYPGYYWYALFDYNLVNFELVSQTFPTKVTSPDNPSYYGLKWKVTYKVTQKLDESSECLVRFIDEFNRLWFTNRYNAPDPIKQTQNDYAKEYPLSKYPNVWENGKMKVDAALAMKKGDFTVMLAESFTTDYKVKEPEWWEKLLGAVVAIAGVVVGVVLCCTGSGSIVISIGTALMGASATWAVGSIALGAIAGPSSFGIVKNIAGVAQITSIAGSVFLVFGKIKNGIKSLTDLIKTKVDDFLNFFSFDKKVNVEPNIVVNDINTITDIDLDNVIDYALENNIDFKEIFINEIDLSSTKLSDALIRYQQRKLLEDKLVKGMFDLANYSYNLYNQNMRVEQIEEYKELANEYQEMLEENAPNNFYEVLGEKTFTYSMGSYDALAMLDLKIKQNIGENTINTDPAHSIT